MRRSQLSSLACALALGNLLASTVILPLSLGHQASAAAYRRNHYDFANNPRDIFYDTHMMTDGREETVYLLKGETTRYQFLLEEGGTPLSIIVTPCASNITVLMSRKFVPNDNDRRPQESDPFLQSVYSKQMEHKKSIRIGEFKGGGRMTYTTQDGSPGLYILELQALKSDTEVKLYASTTQSSVNLYPQLPTDTRVNITSKSKRSISFDWFPSVEHTWRTSRGNSLEYCISVSRVKNFGSHCSALAHLRGNVRPTAPPFAGFGFSWEKSKQKAILKRAKPVKAVSPKKLFYKCIGSKTSYVFDKAKPGKTYFVDVFVVDRSTQRSSTYRGVAIKTHRRKRKRKLILEENKRKHVTIHKGVKSKSVRFQIRRPVKKAVLELKACRGTLSFEIIHNKNLIHKSDVRRMKIVRIQHMPAGNYIIRFKGKRKRRRSVTVLFSTDSRRYRPPRLPVDRRIKVFTSLTTCANVTLAWMGNDIKQKYCLYKKEIGENEKIRKHRCSDPDRRNDSEKVFCSRFRFIDPRKAVITRTVTGLKPGTNYLFDVYVSRGRSASLVYRNQQIRTKPQC